MTTRFVILLATLLVALPARGQGEFEEATRATAAACVEHLRLEQLPPCVLALQRQVLHLQAIVHDRGQQLKQLEDAVSVIAGNQIATRAFAHCHDSQPGCDVPLQRQR